MAKKNELSLDEMLKAIPNLDVLDLEKMYKKVMEVGDQKKAPFASRFGIGSGWHGEAQTPLRAVGPIAQARRRSR